MMPIYVNKYNYISLNIRAPQLRKGSFFNNLKSFVSLEKILDLNNYKIVI